MVMKSIEECFLEIINSVNNIKKEEDKGDSKINSKWVWSKCRNFSGMKYTLEGSITLNNCIDLYYFFSNKRSCLSLIKNETNIDILSLYVEYLFKTYSIDMFLNNLINKHNYIEF